MKQSEPPGNISNTGAIDYENRFRSTLYRATFIACFFLCSFFFIKTVLRGDLVDAFANAMVIVLSLVGFSLLHKDVNVEKLAIFPSVIFLLLYVGSFAGSSSLGNAVGLFWCLMFLPMLILIIGHIRSQPLLFIVFSLTLYEFYVDTHSWINVEYADYEKQTYIMVAALLCIVSLFVERERYKVTRFLFEQSVAFNNLAELDELTGLLNRRGMNSFLQQVYVSCNRANDQRALLSIDIDNFKQINDSLGHVAGDTVLRQIAILLAKSLRSSDQVARWGGEEFLVCLTYEDKASVESIAEKIRKTIAEANIEYNGNPLAVTISCGVSYSSERDDLQSLINLADSRLYGAKGAGKNRIFSVGSSTHH